jgi:hypothetical protein
MVEVGASVAVISLVLVAIMVGGGTLVLGVLVGSAAPQAANSREARTTMVKIKLAFFIRTISFLFFSFLFPAGNFYSHQRRSSYLTKKT